MKADKKTPRPAFNDPEVSREIDSSDSALHRVRHQLLSLPQHESMNRPRIGVLVELASIYWHRADYPAAISVWQQAIALMQKENQPDALAIAYTSLATTYAHSGDPANAVENAKRAVVHAPHNTAVIYGLASAYDFAGEEAQTFSWLRRALSYDGGFVLAYEYLGRLHFRRGEFEQAEQFLRKAIDLDPNAETATNELGSLLVTLGRFDEAMAQYKAAHRRDPKHPIAINNIGYCYFRMGKVEEAKEWLERRIRAKPEDALATYLLLGVIERASPNANNAKVRNQSNAHFQQALKIYQSKKASLHFSRLIEHDAIHALVLTGMDDGDAMPAWQRILLSPDTKFVGKGSWGDWFYILRALAKSPQPPQKIEEIIELLTQYPQRM